ncbi:multidrug effflux MFS transporter [Legionella dresdenensis]|uniref:Bcr/CflA family efflux transporter n=1 Tax=Legionella dresdenensis TaxID=450200 RepID=A0ABV8CHE8_9GAMM
MGRFVIIISIFLLIVLQQLPVDIYLPSFPEMADHFDVTPRIIQSSLTVYLLGFGASPIFLGILSDRFGRRKILMACLVGYVIAGVACAITNSMLWLLVFRAIQGFASGGLQITTSAMARDITTGKSLLLLSSYMSLVWSVIPILAPAIGGYIENYLGWRGNFYFILVWAVPVFYFVARYLPETNRRCERLSVYEAFTRFNYLFHNGRFIFYVIATGLSFSLTIAFCTAAPFLFQKQLGFSEIRFGWLMFIVSGSYLLGVAGNSYLLNHFSVNRIISGGLLLTFLSALAMVYLAVMKVFTGLAVIIPVFLIVFGQGFVFPNAIGLAMDSVKQYFGLSSSVLTSCQMIIVGIVSQCIANFANTTQLPLALTMLVISVLLGMLYLLLHRVSR